MDHHIERFVIPLQLCDAFDAALVLMVHHNGAVIVVPTVEMERGVDASLARVFGEVTGVLGLLPAEAADIVAEADLRPASNVFTHIRWTLVLRVTLRDTEKHKIPNYPQNFGAITVRQGLDSAGILLDYQSL